MGKENFELEEKDILSQAVINQIEKDLEEQEYDSLDEILIQLMKSEESKKILFEYLSDEIKKEFNLL